jgi:hypothetical protein
MTTATTVHTLHIDSRDRDPGGGGGSSPAAYRVRLPTKFKNVVSARLLTAEIPSSFYIFRAEYGNTSLKFVVYPPSAPEITHTITIPDGNYTVSQLGAALRTALNTAFAPLVFEVGLSKTTLKLSFANEDGYDMGVDTTGSLTHTKEWGLGYYAGFRKDEVIAGPIVTAPRVASTNPYTYVILDIEELNGAYEGGMDGSAMAPHGCFAKIPFGNNSFEYVFMDASQSPPESIKYKPMLPSLESLRVRFRFHDGRLVNFEDVEHSFSLELECKPPAQRPTDHTDAVSYQAAQAVDAATAASSAASAAAQAVSSMAVAQKHVLQEKVVEERLYKVSRRRWYFVGAVVLLVVLLVVRNTKKSVKS